MSIDASVVGSWVTDYYFLATLLTLVTLVITRLVRQPVQRLTVLRLTVIGLGVLAATCAMPDLPRVRVLSQLMSRSTPEAPGPSFQNRGVDTPRFNPNAPTARSPMPETEAVPKASDGSGISDPLGTQSLARSRTNDRESLESPGGPLVIGHYGTAIGYSYIAGAGLVGLWMLWGAACSLWLGYRAKPAPKWIQDVLSESIAREQRVPRVLMSPSVSTAAAMGLFKPSILLSPEIAKRDFEHVLKAALAHEVAHIRNGDLWLLAATRTLRLFLFAHPLFWLLCRRVAFNQELLADSTAASASDRQTYAEALVSLARSQICRARPRVSASLAIYEGSSWLASRVKVLLDDTRHIERSPSRRCQFVSFATLTAFLCLLSPITFRPGRPESQVPFESSAETRTVENAQEVIRRLERQGAILRRDANGHILSVSLGRWALGNAQPLDFQELATLEEIQLYDGDLDAQDLPRLGKFAAVGKILLNGNQFSRDSIDFLKSLPQLTELVLEGALIDDDSLSILSGWKGLQGVELRGTSVTEPGLSRLRDVPDLRHLKVTNLRLHRLRNGHYQVTDVGVEQIAGIENLQSLHLDFATKMTDVGAKHLSRLEKLERLDLARAPLTDEGLRYLGRLSNLNRLFLSNTNISSKGIAHLQGLNRLKELYINNSSTFGIDAWLALAELPNLDGPYVTPIAFKDSELARVSSIKHWTTLGLPRGAITDTGLHHLGKMSGIETLTLSDSAVTDAGLVHLQNLRRLKYLDLNDSRISDHGLAYISGLTDLEHLSLWNTATTDEGLAHIESLKALTNLGLSGTQITSAGLANLRGMTGLELLILSRTQIDGKGLQHLRNLRRLRFLSLSDTEVDNAGLRHLADLRDLQNLDLGNTNVSDDGMRKLIRLSSLRNLGLTQCGITSDGMDHIARLKNLQSLNLNQTSIDDAGLAKLSALRKIKLLFLVGTNVTDAGIAELRHLPMLSVLMVGKKISDVGLRHLQEIKSLQQVSLIQSNISDEALAAFKKARPGVAVKYTKPLPRLFRESFANRILRPSD